MMNEALKFGIRQSFNNLITYIHNTSVNNGFWEQGANRNKGECLALIHAEISEALEGLREDNLKDKHLPKYLSVEVELADAIIRILDMAHGYNYNIIDALIDKVEYNSTREYMHGKQF